jgi:hypothetical protein
MFWVGTVPTWKPVSQDMDFRLETSAEEPARLDGQRDESIPDGPSTGLAKEHQKGMLAEVMDCLEDLLSR